MKRPSSVVIAAVLAFVFAGFASLLAYNYLKKQGSKPFQGMAIVSAATDIPIGTKLDASHLRLATWPKEGLPSGYYTDAKVLLGRVAIRQLSPGDIVTEQKLMPLNAAASGGIMTYMVPQGHRAVTVAVNEVAGVAGFITPNSRVDIVLTSSLSGENDQDNNMSKIILQNVPVLATGQITEQKDGKPAIVPTVTLDLLPDDAEKLIVGAKKGSLQLLLRNVIDIAAVNTHGATVTNVLGRGERIVHAKTAAPKRVRQAGAPPHIPVKFTIEVIKGGNKSTREFSAE
ncbi:MAG TPA: Flp pilus assembly protein CpaB [Geobacteraceae bacterium]|nr:Flp pilus assembly protein CpaB [Geobacteraceae bacterium]